MNKETTNWAIAGLGNCWAGQLLGWTIARDDSLCSNPAIILQSIYLLPKSEGEDNHLNHWWLPASLCDLWQYCLHIVQTSK
jgi:hypothetical protein